jgi:predicted dehydrogenase
MTQKTCRVAVVGCGQIADAHLQEIRKVGGARLVAVCDRHPELARQAAARFGVPAAFDDLGRMLADARPDVLHVTTPPHTHCAVAKQALAAGAHVYVEKPFTPDVREADELLAEAEARGRLVCVGHDQLFDPAWEECRRRHLRGDLGRVLHVDSVQGYHLDGPFGRALMEEPDHWVHRLPGGLFQNVISHALYRITEFLPDEHPRVWACWFGRRGAAAIPTELRVMLRGEEVTATLCFSAAVRPVQRVTRVHGEKGSVEVDLEARSVRRLRAPALPGPFGKMDVPFRQARESLRALAGNAWRFLRRDLHYFAGMNCLFRLFYRAVAEGGPPPIAYAEIRRVTAIMDAIFTSCRQGEDETGCRCGAEPELAAGRGVFA